MTKGTPRRNFKAVELPAAGEARKVLSLRTQVIIDINNQTGACSIKIAPENALTNGQILALFNELSLQYAKNVIQMEAHYAGMKVDLENPPNQTNGGS